MARYAIRHDRKNAEMEIFNSAGLSALTLACKLGLADMFNSIIELQSYVRLIFAVIT